MKNWVKNIVIVVLILLLAVGFFALLRRAQRPQQGYVQVPQTFLDSLVAVANIKPDTIIVRDTVILKKVVYVNRPVPSGTEISVDPIINVYRDSIVNSEVAAWVNLTTNGYLTDLSWEYRPMVREITKEVIVTKPVPVPYEKKVPQTGVYGSIGAGLGRERVIVSGELKYLDKKSRMYGIEVGNFHESYIKLEYGIKF